jgi:hypothetical protein
MPQAFLDQRAQRDATALRHLSGIVQEGVSNLDGCFHMGAHIVMDADMCPQPVAPRRDLPNDVIEQATAALAAAR